LIFGRSGPESGDLGPGDAHISILRADLDAGRLMTRLDHGPDPGC
jgi:hypothetical protein